MVIISGIFVVFVTLVVSPDLRRQAYTYVIPAFNLYQVMSLRRHIRERDFITSANLLNRHLDLSMKLSSGRSAMVLGLVQAFDLVVEQARFEADFKALKKPLERLVKIEPDLFLGRIWLARALWYENPEASLEQLNIAISLVSSDERSYRQGIEAALEMGQKSLAQEYCNKYKLSQFGGSKPRSYNHLYRGIGLRRLGLLTKMKDGQEALVTNSGLELNQRRTYGFSIPNPNTIELVELHLGTLPGLDILFHGLSLTTPNGILRYDASDIVVSTRSAYVADDEYSNLGVHIITTEANDEVLRLRLPGKTDHVGHVAVDLTFRRLDLATKEICPDILQP